MGKPDTHQPFASGMADEDVLFLNGYSQRLFLGCQDRKKACQIQRAVV